MLGRALPLRDSKTGKILKWFGTCTDIHDLVQARQSAKRTREQLQTIIKHAKVTMWTVDPETRVTFLEGPLMWEEDRDITPECVGKKVAEIFGYHKGYQYLDRYMEPIQAILSGKAKERVSEHYIDGNNKWYRTRFAPMLGKKNNTDENDEGHIEGVVCTSFDVSELKRNMEELQSQERENDRLMMAENSAKEASRLKSQFLANMSHEIRTPIAGVIGSKFIVPDIEDWQALTSNTVAELLGDTELDDEQRECAENIQRSANGLLTVINVRFHSSSSATFISLLFLKLIHRFRISLICPKSNLGDLTSRRFSSVSLLSSEMSAR